MSVVHHLMCAIAGQGKDTNSYSIAGTQGKRITTDMSESGELCYLLNGSTTPEEPIWYQTLGEDSHPVLLRSHGIIEKTDEGYQNKEGNGIYTPQMGKVETPYRIDGTKSQVKQVHLTLQFQLKKQEHQLLSVKLGHMSSIIILLN